ncbi:Uncharacterized protein TCM_036319 [Theobroma cacao]|uniref:Uncharacterized protein n=1 Tax=Theobroma cacao TaxID=3641 RepID=A0A061FRN8_THECC|nr:Uncharacterized protein TCM_036319 [Theobroma cacao]
MPQSKGKKKTGTKEEGSANLRELGFIVFDWKKEICSEWRGDPGIAQGNRRAKLQKKVSMLHLSMLWGMFFIHFSSHALRPRKMGYMSWYKGNWIRSNLSC